MRIISLRISCLAQIILGLCLLAQTVPAQHSSDELNSVLENYLQAMGGRAALEQIISVRMRGTIHPVNGDSYSISVLKKRPDRVRVHMETNEIRIVQAYNGKEAWYSRTTNDDTLSAFMPVETAEEFIRNAPIESILLNPDRAEVALNLLDDVEVAGMPAYRIEARLPNGFRQVYYIEKDTFLERRILNYDQHGNLLSEMVPSKFTRINGVVFALQQINFLNGKSVSTVVFEKIEVNVGLLESIFDPPVDLRRE